MDVLQREQQLFMAFSALIVESLGSFYSSIGLFLKAVNDVVTAEWTRQIISPGMI